MLRPLLAMGLAVALGMAGCDCRGDTNDPMLRDGGRRDAGPMIDAGRVDAGSVDAGPPPTPDAGTTCACPPLPDTCQAPPTDTPVFGPTPTNEILAQLLGVISCADTTLHLAAYETTFICLVDAVAARLEAAPGLQVDLVIDDGMCPLDDGGMLTCPWNAIATHPRVRIVGDDRAPYMHHKFAIADGDTLWVGSANYTRSSYCTDHNNSIVIDEPAIVARYEEVFQRMFTSMGFGPVDPEPPVTGGIYTVYFSPESPAGSPPAWFDDMIAAIDAATTSIEFVIFAYTRDEVTMALVRAHMRGVAVRGVVATEYGGDPAVQGLVTAGIEVHEGNVHDKVMVIDGNLVIAGSPNWSMNAWSNNENSLWIRDAAIAAAYDAQGDMLFAATPPAMPSM